MIIVFVVAHPLLWFKTCFGSRRVWVQDCFDWVIKDARITEHACPHITNYSVAEGIAALSSKAQPSTQRAKRV
jgi:hypothetical protein